MGSARGWMPWQDGAGAGTGEGAGGDVLGSSTETLVGTLLAELPRTWQQLLQDLQGVVAAIGDAQCAQERALRRLPEGGDAALEGVRTHFLAQGQAFALFYRDEAAVRAAALAATAAHEATAIAAIRTRAYAPLEPARAAIERCLRHLASTQHRHDPWLEHAALRHHCAQWCHKHAAALDELLRALELLRTQDAQLARARAQLAHDFFTRHAQHQAALLHAAEPLLGPYAPVPVPHVPVSPAHDAAADWDGVLKAHGLTAGDVQQLAAPRSHVALCAQLLDARGIARDTALLEAPVRVGFLLKPSAALLLARTWGVALAVFCPHTRFMHVYSLAKGASCASDPWDGQVMAPDPAQAYAPAALADLNALAHAFFFAPHHPAGLSPVLLSPGYSVDVASAAASDPASCAFSVRSRHGDKFSFRAFCEEDMVDWVLALTGAQPPIPISASSTPQVHSEPEPEPSVCHVAPDRPPSYSMEMDNPWD